MKNTDIRGFSFIELLITITILGLISIIAVSSFSQQNEASLNTKVQSEISTLENSLLLYKQENSELPQPKWNRNFFTKSTNYAHSYEDDETFWVHGFITNNSLAKKYIDIIPVDPRTGSFYAYWKTKWTEMYEIAWVIAKNDSYSSFVSWDYTAENGPFNLIREYNGPLFVKNNSQNNFPYNPYERVLTAKISDYSWDITINSSSYTQEEVLSYELISGDMIEISSGGYAELYYSDGTYSVLWDETSASKVIIQTMEFPEENNLITNIKLILESGMIWNKAANLDDESEFQIYTTDSTAAVRWTVFWVQKNDDDSQIIIQEWKVAVALVSTEDISELQESITNKTVVTQVIDTDNSNISYSDNESILSASDNNQAVWIQISDTEISYNSSAIEAIPSDIYQDLLATTTDESTEDEWVLVASALYDSQWDYELSTVSDYDINTNQSGVSIERKNGFDWVLIDNDDYLKYSNVSELFRDDYILEMRINIPTVDNTNDVNKKYLLSSVDWLELWLDKNNKLNTKIITQSRDEELKNIDSFNGTIDLWFQTISIKKSDDIMYYSISWSDWTEMNTPNIKNLMYIWSNPIESSQINSIIDYIKVYKK